MENDIEAKKSAILDLKKEMKEWRREEFVKNRKPEKKEEPKDVDVVKQLLKKLEGK